MNPIISIIIPVFNVYNYLDKCISSCISQTLKDIEIIIVNDGSTDESYRIIECYLKIDPRISVINKNVNEGVLLARLDGIESAKGEYIYFLDGDDYIEHNALEILLDFAYKYKVDFVKGSMYINTEDKQNESSFLFAEDEYSGHFVLNKLIDNYSWNIWNNLIKRDVFSSVFRPSEAKMVNFGEDAFFMIQLLSKVNKVYITNQCTYHYVIRETSIMHDNNNTKLINSCILFIKSLYFLINKMSLDQILREKISYVMLERVCFILNSKKSFQSDKEWMKDYLKKEFIYNRRNRIYVINKNKFIYLRLLIHYLLICF